MVENVKELLQEYESRMESLEREKDELYCMLEQEIDELEKKETNLRGKIILLKRQICNHVLKPRSWRLKGSEIEIASICDDCGADFKTRMAINDGMKFLKIAIEPEAERTYYFKPSGGVYFVKDGLNSSEAFGIHLKESYLDTWKKALKRDYHK